MIQSSLSANIEAHKKRQSVNLSSSPPPANIEAHIQGEVSGQTAVGNNILQTKIGDVHGGMVNVISPEKQPHSWPRPVPIFLRPRPFSGLLDRAAEIDAADAALQSALPVEFYGQAGVGKTSLLRHLAHHLSDVPFPDGIIYLSARHQFVADLLQCLYEIFYDSDVPFKPTGVQIRHALQNKHALVLLDDVGLTRDEVGALMDAVPGCTFILASPERRLWGEGRAIALQGLPPDDALALVGRELGRPLTPEERPSAHALCTALAGHPLRILQAAAMVRERGYSLAEIAQRVQSVPPAEALTALVLESLSEPERRVLMALAALKGASLHADHLFALTGLPRTTPVLDSLLRRGLVQAHGSRYTLAGTLVRDLQALDLTPWTELALAYFVGWAERHRSTPARLSEEADAILQALEWAVRAGRWRGVLRLGRAVEGALALGRRWDAWEQVLQWMLQAAQALEDLAAQAWVLHQSGTRALCLGDALTARTFLVRALRVRESLGDRVGTIVTRHNLNVLMDSLPTPSQRSAQPSQSPSPDRPVVTGTPLLPKEIATFVCISFLALSGLIGIWIMSQLMTTLASVSPVGATRTQTFTAAPAPSLAVTPAHTPMRPILTPTPLHTPTFTHWPCGKPPSEWDLYTVQGGDTLYSLARHYATTNDLARWVDQIIFYNCLENTRLKIDQRLYLPPLPTPTCTPTNTPSFTPTPTSEPTFTSTPMPTTTPTSTPTLSFTPTPTSTPTNMPTLTPTPTSTPTFKATPTNTPTLTFTPTPTTAPTNTPTLTPAPTNTSGPETFCDFFEGE